MTGIPSFMASAYVQAWSWALLNFLWQGALVALVLKGILVLTRRSAASLRYRVAMAALILMVCIPVISLWKSHARQPETTSFEPAPAVAAHLQAAEPSEPEAPARVFAPATQRAEHPIGWFETASAEFFTCVPWISAIWLAGALLAGIRTLAGLWGVRSLRKRASPASARLDLSRLARKMGVRGPVRLLESECVSAPTVIGWLRPAILLPSGTALEAEASEALLAHELAHIRRRDYLANLFQAGVESMLFFHPAVWWVSLQARAERECCCDDDAVAVCGSLLTYVRALSQAEHSRCASKMAVAAGGASLLNRIRRLTEMKTSHSNRSVTSLIGLTAMGLIIGAAAGSGLLAYVPVHFEAAQQEQARQAPIATPAATAAAAQPSVKVTVAKKVQSAPAAINPGPTAPAPATAEDRTQTPAQQTPDQKMLTGTVCDPDGAVMPGVAVSILSAESGEVLQTAYSDARGHFEIAAPARSFILQFVQAGFQPRSYKSSELGSTPLAVSMALGQIREVVTVMTGATTPQTVPGVGKPIRVGGNVYPPKLIKKVDPAYPPEARDQNVEGTVDVSALIDEDGNVKDPVILSGHPLLSDAALQAVLQWRYRPGLLNGVPRPLRLNITLVFKLDR